MKTLELETRGEKVSIPYSEIVGATRIGENRLGLVLQNGFTEVIYFGSTDDRNKVFADIQIEIGGRQ